MPRYPPSYGFLTGHRYIYLRNPRDLARFIRYGDSRVGTSTALYARRARARLWNRAPKFYSNRYGRFPVAFRIS